MFKFHVLEVQQEQTPCSVREEAPVFKYGIQGGSSKGSHKEFTISQRKLLPMAENMGVDGLLLDIFWATPLPSMKFSTTYLEKLAGRRNVESGSLTI